MSKKAPSQHEQPEIDALCRSFVRAHGLDGQRIEPLEAGEVVSLEKVWEILDAEAAEVTERLVKDPAWGCLRTMLKKTRGHVLSSVLLYVAGQPASAEVVARSVLEASVNVLYILHRDRNERLGRYLSSYLAEQREKVDLWERSLVVCPAHEIDAHRAGITQKRQALADYAMVVTSAFSGCGFRFDPTAKLPNAFDRFREVGKEVSYRTEYIALCNQTHDAAEDLLNQFVIHICSPELVPMLDLETKSFSRMMIHVGVGYFFEACKAYATAFGLEAAVTASERAIQKAGRSAQEAAMGFHNSELKRDSERLLHVAGAEGIVPENPGHRDVTRRPDV